MGAGLYVRISQDREGAGLGVERQRKDCQALCDRLGWTVADTYVDNDVSAYRRRSRPEYERLLADIAAGQVDAVVTWHTDRLHRSPRELEDFIDVLEPRGVTVQTVKAGPLDLATPAGRMVARQLGSVARYESEHKSERIRRKTEELAHAGRSGGGPRAFGFEPDLVTHRPAEAAVLLEAAHRADQGESLNALCRWLNDERRIPSATGKRWQPNVLKRALLSPRAAGLRQHRGVVVGPAAWAPIIPAELHASLNSRLGERRRLPVRRTHLLTGGPARCGRCGAALLASRNHGQRAYRCLQRPGGPPACGRLLVAADPFEYHVENVIMARILRPAEAEKIAAQMTAPASADDADQIGELEASLEQLGEDFGSGLIGRIEFLAARARLQQRIDELQPTVRVTPNLRDLPVRDADALAAWWEAAPLVRRRAVVDLLVERVTVAPIGAGRRFDPKRVNIDWRT